ncbi:MAG: efflux RND transporter permease subunit [Flavobacteriaceae bacterium]|nr:efflux RND transporter permease subunit [Flavobacteriaceae bacterium]
MNEQKGWLANFFNGFNKYLKKLRPNILGSNFFARKTLRVAALLGVTVLAVALLGIKIPSGFIPEEDQGYIMLNVVLPPASSIQRTDEVTRKIESFLAKEESLLSYTTVNGYNGLTGSYQPNNGFIFISLKPWEDREETSKELVNKLNKILSSQITNATAMAIGPPAIQGLGASAGFSMMLQDRAGNSPQYLEQQTKAFLEAAKKRPEIKNIYTTFNAGSPQVRLEIDNEKAMKLGVSVSKVTEALGCISGLKLCQ